MRQSVRLAVITAVAIAIGVLLGVVAGNHNYTTEHACPQSESCAEPFTATRFHWGWAWGVGATSMIIGGALLVVFTRLRTKTDRVLETDSQQ